MDQTPPNYTQSSRYAIEKSASKSKAIARSGDKCTITATFIINLAANPPSPMQLIYGGKTDRSLPKVDFSKGFFDSVPIRSFMRK